nr:type II toxin-antitoxin system VapC family toxin [Gammaproteobacteria bacterium]
KVPTLDTNVLVRYLVADDKKQFAIAQNYIESKSTDFSLFVPLSVAIELEWVLRSRYEIDKETIISTFISLLETREVQFQEEDSIERALNLYDDSKADFADCLHLAIGFTHEQLPLVTFDRKASKLDDSQLLQ